MQCCVRYSILAAQKNSLKRIQPNLTKLHFFVKFGFFLLSIYQVITVFQKYSIATPRYQSLFIGYIFIFGYKDWKDFPPLSNFGRTVPELT